MSLFFSWEVGVEALNIMHTFKARGWGGGLTYLF